MNCETCSGLDGIHTKASTETRGHQVCVDCLRLQTRYEAAGRPGPVDRLRAARMAQDITGRLPSLGVVKNPEVV